MMHRHAFVPFCGHDSEWIKANKENNQTDNLREKMSDIVELTYRLYELKSLILAKECHIYWFIEKNWEYDEMIQCKWTPNVYFTSAFNLSIYLFIYLLRGYTKISELITSFVCLSSIVELQMAIFLSGGSQHSELPSMRGCIVLCVQNLQKNWE